MKSRLVNIKLINRLINNLSSLNYDTYILSLLEQIKSHIEHRENLIKRENNQLRCLYVVETSDLKIKFGIASNPAKEIKILSKTNNFSIRRIYVSYPMKHLKNIHIELEKVFNDFHDQEGYYNMTLEEIIKKICEYPDVKQNKMFRLDRGIKEDFSGKIYCTNGYVYKNYKTLARAFNLRPKKVLQALNQGTLIKGHHISTNRIKNKKKKVKKKVFKGKVIRRSKKCARNV